MKPFAAPGGLLALALLLALPVDATEAERAATPSVDAFPTPMAAPLARICLAMGAVSAAGAGLAFWSRRRRGVIGGTNARIEIVATRAIGPRHQVVLLDVAGHRLLIGTGGDGIRTLADLTEEEAFAERLARQLPERQAIQPAELVDQIGRFEGLDA